MSSEEITVELMQHILREVEKDNTIVVLPSLGVDSLDEVQHFGSSLNRVKVRYTCGEDKSEHTLSLIVKFILNTNAFALTTMFAREMQMYDEILPRMSNLLNKVLQGNHSDFSPQAYYTQKSPNYVLALEDLAPKHFKAPRRRNGLDMKQCQLAFRTIARFHAASVMIHQEDRSLFMVFDEYLFREEGVRGHMDKTIKQMLPAMSHVVESWPEFGQRWADRIRDLTQRMFKDLLTLWKRDEGSFNVLNHGDFGCHNVMYRNSKSSGEVEEIMFVDFQCCSYNSPVLDLLQFIFTNANDGVNVSHINTLLMEYHAELSASLESLGAPQEQIMSLTDLQQEFDRKLLYGFYYLVCVLPLFSTKEDSNIGAGDMFILGSSDVEKFKSHLSDSYAGILQRLLPYFCQKNVI